MRFSTYGIILPLIGKDDQPVPGKALLVNGLYGAVDVVDEAAATCLRGGDLYRVDNVKVYFLFGKIIEHN